MGRRFGSLSILLILTAVCGFGQIIFGGPGIGFPGSRRYPGQGGQYPGQNQAPSASFSGMLRIIGSNSSISTSAPGNSSGTSLVLETEDNRIVTFSLERKTKYYGSSGGSAKVTDFQPGDHIEVDATQDNSNYYHAVKVSLLRAGTPDERTEASKSIDGSGSSSSSSNSSTGNSSDNNDPDRPRLRRASSSGGDDTSASSAASNSSSSDDSDRPRIRRAAVSSGDDTPRAEIAPGDSPSGSVRPSSSSGRASSDDSGPPVLARGRPSSSSSDSDSVIAGSRPSIRAEEVNGVTRTPTGPVVDDSRPGAGGIRMRQTGDEVIDMAREEAFSFSETLPNYVVKQFTTRFQTEPTRGRSTSWRALDTVTADVVYQDGKESYKNILVNGRTAREAPEKSGSWSSGEFASTLQDIMSPYTDADFHGKRSTTIVNRPAFRYDFSVEQPNSHWHIETSGQSMQPEYTGSVWIDKENYRVLRIELSARNMPRSFPLDQVESSVDYDYVPIGDGKYLLPVHSEALSCARGGSDCSRNVIEFRNYKKFTADATITFDPSDK
jgi:hypothetical protein